MKPSGLVCPANVTKRFVRVMQKVDPKEHVGSLHGTIFRPAMPSMASSSWHTIAADSGVWFSMMISGFDWKWKTLKWSLVPAQHMKALEQAHEDRNFSNSPLDWNKARMWVMCTGATSRCGITLNKTHMNKYMWSSISAHSLTRLKSAQVLSLFQCWFYMPVQHACILQVQPKHIFMDLYSTPVEVAVQCMKFRKARWDWKKLAKEEWCTRG